MAILQIGVPLTPEEERAFREYCSLRKLPLSRCVGELIRGLLSPPAEPPAEPLPVEPLPAEPPAEPTPVEPPAEPLSVVFTELCREERGEEIEKIILMIRNPGTYLDEEVLAKVRELPLGLYFTEEVEKASKALMHRSSVLSKWRESIDTLDKWIERNSEVKVASIRKEVAQAKEELAKFRLKIRETERVPYDSCAQMLDSLKASRFS